VLMAQDRGAAWLYLDIAPELGGYVSMFRIIFRFRVQSNLPSGLR
jgi:hypothetical protein